MNNPKDFTLTYILRLDVFHRADVELLDVQCGPSKASKIHAVNRRNLTRVAGK